VTRSGQPGRHIASACFIAQACAPIVMECHQGVSLCQTSVSTFRKKANAHFTAGRNPDSAATQRLSIHDKKGQERVKRRPALVRRASL